VQALILSLSALQLHITENFHISHKMLSSTFIDEMGYLPLDELGATIFFQLVSARCERGSIILTSNKSYGDWSRWAARTRTAAKRERRFCFTPCRQVMVFQAEAGKDKANCLTATG
jgi:DNA replication protein DnaC